MEDFSKHLKNIRESRGMTVNQLGMYSNISSASISRYESGERKPKPQNVKKLSDALKYDYEELMRLAGHLENEKNKNTNHFKTPADNDRETAYEVIDQIPEGKLKLALGLLKELARE